VGGVPCGVGDAFVITVRGDRAMNGQPTLAASGQIQVAAKIGFIRDPIACGVVVLECGGAVMTETSRMRHDGPGRIEGWGGPCRRGATVLAAGALLMVFVAACTSDSKGADGDRRENGGAATAEAEGGATQGSELMALFSQVPDRPEYRASAHFSLPVRAAEQMGVPVPAADADYREILDYIVALDGHSRTSLREGEVPESAPTVCDQFRLNIQEDALRPELGFSPSAVRGAINFGNPMETSCVLTGDFDPEGIDAVVGTDPAFSGLLEVAEFEGVAYYRWGEDRDDASTNSAHTVTLARPDGQGGRMYVDTGRIYWASADAEVEEMIATGVNGTRASLVDDDGLRLILEHFDVGGVYGGFVSDRVDNEPFCPPFCDEVEEAEASAPVFLTDGIERWGGGWGFTPDGEHLLLLAVVSGDADDTEANLAAIERNISVGLNRFDRPWSTWFEVVDSSADGRLGVMQLTYGTPSESQSHLGGRLANMLFHSDPPFANRE